MKAPVLFSVRLPRELLEAAKDAAWEKRVTLAHVIREALERLVSEVKPKRRKRRDD